jgi:hypothetical protein
METLKNIRMVKEDHLQFQKAAPLPTLIFGSVPLTVRETYMEFSQ